MLCLLNIASSDSVFITITVYWGNEYGMVKPEIFTVVRHFMIILKRNFFRVSILHHITDTDNM